MNLASLRQASPLRQAFIALLLMLQCLLVSAEALTDGLPAGDEHHLQAADSSLHSHSTDDYSTDSNNSTADRCDHCCHCNGHNSHLALPLKNHITPAAPGQFPLPALSNGYLSINPNAIYRPPIV